VSRTPGCESNSRVGGDDSVELAARMRFRSSIAHYRKVALPPLAQSAGVIRLRAANLIAAVTEVFATESSRQTNCW